VSTGVFKVPSSVLEVELPGVVTWQRPRSERRFTGPGVLSAYPAQYRNGRARWSWAVRQAVAETGWVAPPIGQTLAVNARVIAGGKYDLDRIATALLDALQAGGALADDCRVWELHLRRRRPLAGEIPHVAVRLGLLEAAGQ
jgi:hypothetical protein